MKVTHKVWGEKADNFQKRIAANPYPENLDWYRTMLSKVRVGKSLLDCGCGDRHIEKVLPEDVFYCGFDPFPRDERTILGVAESLWAWNEKFETSVCFAALDNVMDLDKALNGIRHVTTKNIVILTGIDIEPDQYHTLKITRNDLTSILGEPHYQEEVLPHVWLMDFSI